MQRPNLNQMWETFIKIPLEDRPITRLKIIYDIIRLKIYPMISLLKSNDMINWYCFLIHNRKSGVPTSENDNNPYFHIRFAIKNISPQDFLKSLPNYCVMTRKIRLKHVESIVGIDKSLLKNEQIEEAWRIIGEQSEWVINMLNIHKEDVETNLLLQHVVQFLHYYSNITQLQIR